MRILFLLTLLALLLGVNLRARTVAPLAITLRPTPAFPGARGTAHLATQGSHLALTLDLEGLPAVGQADTGSAVEYYVIWLVDDARQLYNLGALVTDGSGRVVSTFTPPITWDGPATLAISIETRPDPAAPAIARDTIALAGAVAPPFAPHVGGLAADLGPGWLAPILPAALGLTLLRYAMRIRRAEQQATHASPPLIASHA